MELVLYATSFAQECPPRLSHSTVLYKSPPLAECATRVSHKSALQEYPKSVKHKSVKNVLQACLRRVSNKV